MKAPTARWCKYPAVDLPPSIGGDQTATDGNCTTLVSLADIHKAKAGKLLANAECRLASPQEWAELLPYVRAAYRSIRVDKLGSLAELSEDDAAAFMDQLGATADYLEAIAIACNAAYAIFAKHFTAPGAPLATV